MVPRPFPSIPHAAVWPVCWAPHSHYLLPDTWVMQRLLAGSAVVGLPLTSDLGRVELLLGRAEEHPNIRFRSSDQQGPGGAGTGQAPTRSSEVGVRPGFSSWLALSSWLTWVCVSHNSLQTPPCAGHSGARRDTQQRAAGARLGPGSHRERLEHSGEGWGGEGPRGTLWDADVSIMAEATDCICICQIPLHPPRTFRRGESYCICYTSFGNIPNKIGGLGSGDF